MFNQREQEAYKNISAPDELYFRTKKAIQNKKRSSHKVIIGIACAAACLITVFSINLFNTARMPQIKLNGLELESSVSFYDISPASDMRTSPSLSVPVEIELNESSEVSVSYGTMTVDDNSPCESIRLKDSHIIWWNINRGEEIPECQMRIEGEDNTTIITLKYDEAEKKITATKVTE